MVLHGQVNTTIAMDKLNLYSMQDNVSFLAQSYEHNHLVSLTVALSHQSLDSLMISEQAIGHKYYKHLTKCRTSLMLLQLLLRESKTLHLDFRLVFHTYLSLVPIQVEQVYFHIIYKSMLLVMAPGLMSKDSLITTSVYQLLLYP